ncbi:GspH/FimT family pseudopilin [Variovorax terrae]|uniref:Type II secretion system protein H n=1 Tax=Variovorax terrae TaxID=2923278 RepID=A0A9X2APR9_9BURK|nr:GspH/FimT family pseudopilin [Variovorax terrae]MCJ0765185.1 GspH/FimT family pseudopilin [Variovorax terrae]
MDQFHQLLDHQKGGRVLTQPTRPIRAARRRAPSRGFSLIELMVGVTLLAIALTMAAPSFSEWIRNTQIRSTAESLQNGLQFARAEAVRRNTAVRFQLTSSLDNACVLSTTGTSWVVNLTSSTSPATQCATALSDSTTPFLLQLSPTVTTASSISMTASQSAVSFNGLGRQVATTNPALNVATLTIQVGSSQGSCLAGGGTLRCLNVMVMPAGQIRMCDPSLTSTTTNNDAMAC